MGRDRVTATGEQTSLADRKRRAGQRLFLGFSSDAVDDDLRRLVELIQPAGFVLFARNVVDPAQVRELNRELASLVDPHRPALRAVDQEGGRVQRIRATEWPPMRTVGRGEHTAEVARAIATELRALGFDLNFAPVADVDSNPDNPVIGDRSFAREANAVADHVAAFVRAQQGEGVIACAKHFPGHGDTSTDSHHELPVIDRAADDLRALELVPFRAAVDAGVGTVMTAHVLFEAFDDEHPATLSDRVVPTLLRDELGFEGVVFSDDLEMKAVADHWSPAEQVALTARAGVDVLLACSDPHLQLELFEEMVRLQELQPGMDRIFAGMARRVHALRERFLLHRDPPPPLEVVGSQQHQDLAQRVAAEESA